MILLLGMLMLGVLGGLRMLLRLLLVILLGRGAVVSLLRLLLRWLLLLLLMMLIPLQLAWMPISVSVSVSVSDTDWWAAMTICNCRPVTVTVIVIVIVAVPVSRTHLLWLFLATRILVSRFFPEVAIGLVIPHQGMRARKRAAVLRLGVDRRRVVRMGMVIISDVWAVGHR